MLDSGSLSREPREEDQTNFAFNQLAWDVTLGRRVIGDLSAAITGRLLIANAKPSDRLPATPTSVTGNNHSMSALADPRLVAHMPLLTTTWNHDTVTELVAAKEESWRCDGLGHWAILCNGHYVGWGGFQKQGDEWDFGLVLRTDAFGLGPTIAMKVIEFARGDDRLPYVTFLLPLSRKHLGALERLGARWVGEIEYHVPHFKNSGWRRNDGFIRILIMLSLRILTSEEGAKA